MSDQETAGASHGKKNGDLGDEKPTLSVIVPVPSDPPPGEHGEKERPRK
jgi:hypothetical protein